MLHRVILPADKMYALRHGTTGKIWLPCGPNGFWLFKTSHSLETCWNNLKKCGLVTSEFHEHKVVTIHLTEVR